MTATGFALIPYSADFAAQFKALNIEWIEKYFRVEPMDLAQLSQPQQILLDGGQIFIIVNRESEVVGTCAMVFCEAGVFEIAKMAVAPKAQGFGLGDMLMIAAIEWGRQQKAKKIVILSNTALRPAIALYRKHGFVQIGTQHPDYERCNIQMQLIL